MSVGLIAICLVLGIVSASKWNDANDPAGFDVDDNFLYKFKDLPLKGKVEEKPWSDTYWPSYESGIAHRWFGNDDPEDFSYHLYTLEELKKNLTTEDLKKLSPAEKFDIFNGRYDYPTVKNEWKRTSPNDEGWEGICHGWAPAAYAFKEPNPVTLRNNDGIDVPFGSSDVKALLSFYAGEYDAQAETVFVGERCEDDLYANPEAANNDACADLNAGTFFLVVANKLGKKSESFVIDRDRGIQVWNQPVYSYNAEVKKSSSTSADIVLDLAYTVETQAEWEAHDPYITSHSYHFSVELKGGKVSGGLYDKEYDDVRGDRIDFAWDQKVSKFFGYFASLKKIYEGSTNNSHPVEANTKLEEFNANFYVQELLAEPQGEVILGLPAAKDIRTWTIEPVAEFEIGAIELKINELITERYRQTIRIYEGCRDNIGALIGTYHGEYSDGIYELIFDKCATIVFRSDATKIAALPRFKASYTALPVAAI